ncbi:MAG: DUF4469 domain-containing protein [Treponematales bacterium]
MLDYYLEPNQLTSDPDDFRAQVVNVRSHTESDIIRMMLDRGAGLRESDIIAVLNEFKKVCAGLIAEGDAINTELFNAHPAIKATTLPNGTVEYKKVHYATTLGSGLRPYAGQSGTRKVPAPAKGTVIENVVNLKTGSTSALTPNRDIKVEGQKVKIAGDDPAVGLFFVNLDSEERTQVDPTDIIENTPSHVIAVVPALSVGSYHVQIVTEYSSGKSLAAPRTATFDKPLTVAG